MFDLTIHLLQQELVLAQANTDAMIMEVYSHAQH